MKCEPTKGKLNLGLVLWPNRDGSLGLLFGLLMVFYVRSEASYRTESDPQMVIPNDSKPK